MLKNPNFPGLRPGPPGGPYIAPTDLVTGGEGTRGPLRNNPTPVLGTSIWPRFYGSQGLTHYRILLFSTVNMIMIAYYYYTITLILTC